MVDFWDDGGVRDGEEPGATVFCSCNKKLVI